MADSEDEYDRRRRDKFRKERSDYQERRGDDRGRREEWIDSRRESWNRDRNRRDYREYEVRRRDRYSPPPRQHDLSPPVKRIRRDWDDRGYTSYDAPTYGSGGMGGSHQGWGPPSEMGGNMHGSQHGFSGHSGRQRDQDTGPTQPPMMTFKQFLASQDDTISDDEAVKKYNEYKQEFRRQQLNDFFINHKEEE